MFCFTLSAIISEFFVFLNAYSVLGIERNLEEMQKLYNQHTQELFEKNKNLFLNSLFLKFENTSIGKEVVEELKKHSNYMGGNTRVIDDDSRKNISQIILMALQSMNKDKNNSNFNIENIDLSYIIPVAALKLDEEETNENNDDKDNKILEALKSLGKSLISITLYSSGVIILVISILFVKFSILFSWIFSSMS